MLRVYEKTDVGLVRQSNQDAVKTGRFSEEAAWLIVCDGMGGANGGNIASWLAVDTISEQIEFFAWKGATDATIKNLLISSVYNANVAIFDAAGLDADLLGMGTTAIAVVVMHGVAHIAHVGDSRVYYITEGSITQLTTDHSMVQELVDSGDITAREAQKHPQKNIITRALGVESGISIDYLEHTMEPGSLLLVCSDGLTNYTEDEEIYRISHETDAKELPQRLVDAAKDGGGGDNITIAVLKNEV